MFITDRFSDMVVSGGVNIYPRRGGAGARAPPPVVDVACIGLPDDEMGERPDRPGTTRSGRPEDPLALHAWCHESLAGYKCPKQIRFVDEIHRNPMGKIDKRSLHARQL